jgi:DMSO/TMAO reductase YedYZ molybdopterin-dependent catalytic subunit
MRRQQRAAVFARTHIQANVQALHGLASCAEWTGVKLSTLLEETGIDPTAKWFIAEGADAPHLTRSVPVAKALDDAMIALYQNGGASRLAKVKQDSLVAALQPLCCACGSPRCLSVLP